MSIDAQVKPEVKAATPSKEPIKLSVSGILKDLENGLDRDAIALKYGLSAGEIKEVFKHEKLKNKRPSRKVTRITLIDDTDELTGAPTTALIEGNNSSAMAEALDNVDAAGIMSGGEKEEEATSDVTADGEGMPEWTGAVASDEAIDAAFAPTREAAEAADLDENALNNLAAQ